MRISDWSSDVCSSDLLTIYEAYVKAQPLRRSARQLARKVESGHTATDDQDVFARVHRFNHSDLAGIHDPRRSLQCMYAPPLISSPVPARQDACATARNTPPKHTSPGVHTRVRP